MRQRLLASTLTLVAGALLLFAVPLAVATRGVLIDRALDTVAGEARQIVNFLGDARNCGELERALAALEVQIPDDTTVAVLTADGRSGVAVGSAEVTRGPELREAVRRGEGTAHRGGQLAAAVALRDSRCAGDLIVHLTRDDATVRGDVRRSWLVIGLFAAAVLSVAVVAATLLGRRLSGPFEQLAEAATRLGEGELAEEDLVTGLDEADEIARALAETSERLGRALARGAAFAADTSHQLRTPLTALRLQLESLESQGADPATVTAALAEVDRLTATLEDLEELTRLDAPATAVDLGDVVARRLEAWQRRARDMGREVVFDRDDVSEVHVRGAAIGQAVAVLLDNALEHGRGTVTVRVREERDPDGDPRAVRVEVRDEGAGPDAAVTDPADRADRRGHAASQTAPIVPGTRGRGLPLARSLVEAEGGRLSFGSTVQGTVAGIVVPLRGRQATHRNGP